MAADREGRGALLTEMEQVTGLRRKSLTRLLGGVSLARRPATSRRPRTYGPAVVAVVRVVWESLDYVCAERLTPALLPTARHLAQFGEVELTPVVEEQLGQISRLLLTTHLAHIDFLDEEIAGLSAEIATRLQAEAAALDRLDTIPGVDRQTAEVLVAEIGTDMGRFPTAGHLASWAGRCPGNHESAGKRTGGKTRNGSKWLRRALVGAAHGAARTKQVGRTGLAGQYRRLVVRRGKGRAAVAVGHQILLTAYSVLRDAVVYQESDPGELATRRRERAQARAVEQLRQLGFEVTLTPKQPAA